MTKVVFFKRDEDFVRIESRGHTGYAVNGEDIVCAALSALIQGAALGIIKGLGIKAKYHVNEKLGSLELELPNGLSESEKHDSNVILNTLLLSVIDLEKGYSEYIELEVK